MNPRLTRPLSFMEGGAPPGVLNDWGICSAGSLSSAPPPPFFPRVDGGEGRGLARQLASVNIKRSDADSERASERWHASTSLRELEIRFEHFVFSAKCHREALPTGRSDGEIRFLKRGEGELVLRT